MRVIVSAESVFATAIRQCEELPDEEVRNAQYAYIEQRRINRTLLDQLESQTPNAVGGPDWPARINRRRQALSPYCDRNLICGRDRLPGVYYTIEVDPETVRVVHWEWDDTL